MISITTKSPYALSALVELHHHGDRGPVPIAELARRRDIPVQFLEQLFATLRRAGILRSQRGVKGGYTFARPGDRDHRARDGRAARRPLGAGATGVFADGRAGGAVRARRVDRRRRGRGRDARPPARRCTTSDPRDGYPRPGGGDAGGGGGLGRCAGFG